MLMRVRRQVALLAAQFQTIITAPGGLTKFLFTANTLNFKPIFECLLLKIGGGFRHWWRVG